VSSIRHPSALAASPSRGRCCIRRRRDTGRQPSWSL
jgi:hypothetical protein